MKENQNYKNTLKLVLIQFDPIWEDASANRNLLPSLLEQLSDQPDVIILPESFNTGFSMNPATVAEKMDGVTVQLMHEIAAKFSCAVCGSIFIEEEGKFYNRFIWMEPNGKPITYDKRHLFSMGDEQIHYSPGNTRIEIEYNGWRIFPQICYDLRFPVWSRNTMNYDLLINVANWPATRRKIWKTLLRARAIENQCYVAAVNRLGSDGNGIVYSGDSMVINPKGEVLCKAKSKSGITITNIDLELRRTFLSKFNTLKDVDHFNIQP